MEKPNVVLKKIKEFRGSDGYGLNAEVWIDGLYCMFVRDSGNGGCLDIDHMFKHGNDEYNKMIKSKIKLLEDYVKTLPYIKSSFGDEHNFPVDIEMYINQLVDQINNDKRLRKLEKKAILIGVQNGDNVRLIKYQHELIKYGVVSLQGEVDRIINLYCKDGVVILNKSLKPLGVTY